MRSSVIEDEGMISTKRWNLDYEDCSEDGNMCKSSSECMLKRTWEAKRGGILTQGNVLTSGWASNLWEGGRALAFTTLPPFCHLLWSIDRKNEFHTTLSLGTYLEESVQLGFRWKAIMMEEEWKERCGMDTGE